MANIKTFDLNLLRVLDALLSEGTTVRAAARLGLSQPAVSSALGRLRESLGDRLFIRRGQGLEPTDFARALAPDVRAAMSRVEAILRPPAPFDPAAASGSFRISGSDFFAELLMPRLADRLTREAPGLRVQLVDLVPDGHVQSVEKHGVDIALVPDTSFPGWIGHEPVFHSGFVAIARAGHPRLARAGLAPGDTVPLELFCDLGHVVFSPEGRPRALGDAALARLGRERRIVMTMPVFSGVWRAVSESELVALIPEQLARAIARRAGLEIYLPPMPVDPALISMIWPRRSADNPAHAWLRRRIAETLRPLNEGYPPLPPVA